VLANSYSNIFLLTAGINLLAIIPAMFLRSGPAVHSDGPATVMVD
jgi:hypothetical protein